MKMKVLEGGFPLKKGRPNDAGFDVFLPADFTIQPLETIVIGAKVCLQLDHGYAARAVIRSSISKTGLFVRDPLIDETYRGEIHLMCLNCSKEPLSFKRGERLCSIVVFPVNNSEIELVDELDENTERGIAWSGSSGK